MKTRFGFVSNSSSTSYTVVTTVKKHQKIIAALDKKSRAVMGVLFETCGTEAKFCSHDCFVFAMVFSSENSNCFKVPGYSTDYEDEGKENYVDVGQSLGKYIEVMRNAAKNGEAIVKSNSC